MNSALIVINVQESSRHRPKWQAVSDPDVVSQVGRLVAAARHRGDLVVWILHAEPGTGTLFDPARGYARLIDGLATGNGERVLVKSSSQVGTDWPSQCGSLTRCRSTPGGTVASRRVAPGRGTDRALTCHFVRSPQRTPLRHQQSLPVERARPGWRLTCSPRR